MSFKEKFCTEKGLPQCFFNRKDGGEKRPTSVCIRMTGLDLGGFLLKLWVFHGSILSVLAFVYGSNMMKQPQRHIRSDRSDRSDGWMDG